MELSQEQIAAILEEAKPSIIDGLRKEVIQQARWQVTDVIGRLIKEEVTNFAKTEIIPEIQKSLAESKDGLVKVAIETSNAIATELAQALSQEVKTKMESSWNRKKVFEAMFG